MSKTGNESNTLYLVGFSAVLPGNELLKKLAVLLDSIVCDDLSFHFAKEGASRRALEFKAYIDAVYEARVGELRWLKDAGVLSPLERFATQIGITKDELNQIRKTSQEAAAEVLRGDGPQVIRFFVGAYGRCMAGHLCSRDIEVVSICVLNGSVEVEQQDAMFMKSTEIVEILLERMPQADNGANWDGILKLRHDPRLMSVRADLRHLLRRLARQEIAQGQVRAELSALYQRYEELMTIYNVAFSYGPLQVILRASAGPSSADHLAPDLGFTLGRRTIQTVEANAATSGEICYAFPGVRSPDVSEEPGPSFFAPSAMISLPDLGHNKPSLGQLVEITQQFNAPAGMAALARINSYLSLTHLSGDQTLNLQVQQKLCHRVCSPARIREMETAFSSQRLYDKWVLLHRAQLFVGIKLLAIYGSSDGGNCLQSEEDWELLGEFALAINSCYGPGPTEPDRPVADVLAQMAAQSEFYNLPQWQYGLVRVRMLLGPILHDYLAGRPRDTWPPPFERIFALLTGLNFRDFLDITLHLNVEHSHDLIAMVDTDLMEYVDTAVPKAYVSGQVMKAWADLMAVDPDNIQELIDDTGRERAPSFFFDFTVFRRYPFWRADDHRYFCIDAIFLTERLSSFGFYWVVINGLVDETLRGAFQSLWGELIQEYVRRLLDECCRSGNEKFFRRPTYNDDATEVFDAAIISGNCLIAFEIKGSAIPIHQKYSGSADPFFEGISAKFGKGKSAAVEQLLRNIGLVFAAKDSRDVLSIPVAEIREIFPVAVTHEPMLRSGFAAHALEDEFRAGVRNLRLKTDVHVHPMQVIDIEDLERLEPYLLSRDFTFADCLRAKINEDPRHRWGFCDFMRMRYLPSRGISPRSNARVDATLEWLIEATLWRLYRGDYFDANLGPFEPTGRAYICVRPDGGDDLLSEEEKVFSEHDSVEEAYRALDELGTSKLRDFKILPDSFEFRVVDQFGTALDRPCSTHHL